jgi:hypothetical protein
MSTLDLSLIMEGGERNALIGKGQVPLRIVLLPGEVLRLPRVRALLHVVAGAAWITRAGKDTVVSAGEQVTVPAVRDPAVISGLGARPLMVEMS